MICTRSLPTFLATCCSMAVIRRKPSRPCLLAAEMMSFVNSSS